MKLRFELHANLNPNDVVELPPDPCGGEDPTAAFMASGVILDPSGN
jgi:hypothetical protein